jgi:hypothetical protein
MPPTDERLPGTQLNFSYGKAHRGGKRGKPAYPEYLSRDLGLLLLCWYLQHFNEVCRFEPKQRPPSFIETVFAYEMNVHIGIDDFPPKSRISHGGVILRDESTITKRRRNAPANRVHPDLKVVLYINELAETFLTLIAETGHPVRNRPMRGFQAAHLRRVGFENLHEVPPVGSQKSIEGEDPGFHIFLDLR